MRLIIFFKERFLVNLFFRFPWILWDAWCLGTGNPFLESSLFFNWLNNAMLIWWCFWASLRFFLTIFWTALRVNKSLDVFKTPSKLREICLDNKAILFRVSFWLFSSSSWFMIISASWVFLIPNLFSCNSELFSKPLLKLIKNIKDPNTNKNKSIFT